MGLGGWELGAGDRWLGLEGSVEVGKGLRLGVGVDLIF